MPTPSWDLSSKAARFGVATPMDTVVGGSDLTTVGKLLAVAGVAQARHATVAEVIAGLGLAGLAAGALLYATGASTVDKLAHPGTAGEILISATGANRPAWSGSGLTYAGGVLKAEVNSNAFPVFFSASNLSSGNAAGAGFSFSTGDSSGYVGCFSGAYATAALADRVILSANSAAAAGVGVYIPTAGQTFDVIGTGGTVTARFPTAGGLILGTDPGGSATLRVGGDVAFAKSGTTVFLTLGTNAAAGSSAIRMYGTGTTTNWLIGCQYNGSGVFEITPSTAAGGTTFSVPAIHLIDGAPSAPSAAQIRIGQGAMRLGATIVSTSTTTGALTIAGWMGAAGAYLGSTSGANAVKLAIIGDATTAAAPQHVLIGIPNTAGNRSGAIFAAIDGSQVNQGSVAGFAAQIVSGTSYPNIVGRLDIVAQNSAATSTVATFGPSAVTIAPATIIGTDPGGSQLLRIGGGVACNAASSLADVVSSGSLAGDYLYKINNTNATGRGLRVQPGADAYEALAVRNAAGSTITFSVLGSGAVDVVGDISARLNILGQRTTTGIVISAGTASNNGMNMVLYGATAGDVCAEFRTGGTTVAKFDDDATAGNTRFLIYDVDNGAVERVSVGAADSGGVGFKLLRIPN